MPAWLHDTLCRALANGWGPGWADICDCAPGRYEKQQRVAATGRAGTIASIFRPRAGGIRFVVEDDDGQMTIFTAEQLDPRLF